MYGDAVGGGGVSGSGGPRHRLSSLRVPGAYV